MTLLLAIAFIVFLALVFFADRAIKTRVQRRRRRAIEERLGAAQAEAEAKVQQQLRAAQAREALTSVMPGIHQHKPRHVNEPSLSPSRAPSSPSRAEPGDRRVA